jgi:ribonuclease BN (tRNA processing enzyme)
MRRITHAGLSRRAFLGAAAAFAARGLLGDSGPARAPGTRLILLGTGGGPRPHKERSAPSQVILSGGAAYVVDCGDGVARQLVLAGVPLAGIRHVLITHHHSDHNADYGNLLLLAWTAGLRTRVDTWGPPPLQRMTKLFLAENAYDIKTRVADEGRVPLPPLIHPHELTRGGAVLHEGPVKVSAALVHHPPVTPAFAYRLDAPDRSIVISGDTTVSANLVKLARDADVLVHEALYPPAIDKLVAGVSNASDLKRSILSHHTSVSDAGRVAAEAGVKTLVLSHLIPADGDGVTDQMWIDAASAHFRGRIIVGKDLLEI